MNIIIRALLYLAQTYRDYFERTNQNLYKSKAVEIPKPELYVIYVGDQKSIPSEISLSKDFFCGMDVAVDVRIKVICEGARDSIINQYIIFSKVYDEQRKKYGRARKAITETIRICKDRNVLREYLDEREKEAVSIMMSLYDEEEVMRSYIKSERYEAARETARETAEKMIRKGKMSLEDIADYVPVLSMEELKEIEAEVTRQV